MGSLIDRYKWTNHLKHDLLQVREQVLNYRLSLPSKITSHVPKHHVQHHALVLPPSDKANGRCLMESKAACRSPECI